MSSLYQRLVKKILNKDVEDTYSTEAQEYDQNKPLSEQVSLNEDALSMGMSAGKISNLSKSKKLEKIMSSADRIKQSRNPAQDIRKESAMDVLGAKEIVKKPEEIVPVSKGGKPASEESKRKLLQVLEDSQFNPEKREKLQIAVKDIIKARK